MEEEIITKQLRHFVMTKRLNILIGSGASMPVIPLMSHFKTSSITENEANNQLSNKVKEVSKKLVEDSFKNSDNESIE